jgi:hypothetical protein
MVTKPMNDGNGEHPTDPLHGAGPGSDPKLSLDGMGRKVCGARTRAGAKRPYCQRSPVPGRERCDRHGGKTPAGPLSPHWRGGKRSKYLPVAVARLYREAANDPELLNARGTVALLEARARQLMQRLTTPESMSLWDDLKAAAEALQAAAQKPDAEARAGAMLAAARRIVEMANRAEADEHTWKDLLKVEVQKLSAQESEWARLKDLRQVATAEEVLAPVRAIAESVARHVSNPTERLAICNDIVRLTNADRPNGDGDVGR